MLIALGVFAIALAARLIFLFNSPDVSWPHSIFYEGDAILWTQWAAAIDRGEPFQFDLPIHPPGVAHAIAWLYRGVHERGFAGIKGLWCAMSAAACALTYLACVMVMPRRVAVLASLLLTWSFGQYVLATSLNSETPYLLLLAAIVLVSQPLRQRADRMLAVGAGALHGLAMLLRPEHPLLLLMFIAWLFIGRRTFSSPHAAVPFCARIAHCAIIVAVALAVCLPWTAHAVRSISRFNDVEPKPVRFGLAPVVWTGDGRAALGRLPAFARLDGFDAINDWAQRQQRAQVAASDIDEYFRDVFGFTPRPLSRIVLVSSQGPMSFALANHPQSDGGFSRAALAHPMRVGDQRFAFAFPPHNRIFNEGWRIGWEYITADPLAWLKLAGRKLRRFGDGATSGFGAANLPLGRDGVRQPVDMLIADRPLARYWQMCMLALIAAGAALGLARRVPIALWLLVVLYKVVVTTLFYGYARQAASIAPAFFVLIAIALDSLLLVVDRRWPRWQGRQWQIVAAICAGMFIGDVAASRRNERLAVVGNITPRPDLGPAAFESFERIEIRRAP